MAEKKKIKTKKIKERKVAGPRVSHTKGYYRFSKEFPSVTDSEGFRDNDTFVNSNAKKAALRRRLALLFACVFVVSFCVTALCFAISDVPVAQEDKESFTSADVPEVKFFNKIITCGGDALVASGVEKIVSECKTAGADTVIVELKDAEGHFYFKPSISVSAEAVATVVDNIGSIVDEMQQQGLSVYASVSCFADDIYARNNQSVTASVTVADDSESIWYGGENGSNGWLSPFSNEVCFYLTTIIGDVAALGVDGIVLENATVPVNAEIENVKFALSQDYEINVHEKTANWLSYTLSTVNCKTAITLSSQQLIADAKKENLPSYYGAACDFVILDARPSDADKGASISGLQYLEPERTPKEYVSALLELGVEIFKANEINTPLVPIIDNNSLSELQLSAVEELSIDTVILK